MRQPRVHPGIPPGAQIEIALEAAIFAMEALYQDFTRRGMSEAAGIVREAQKDAIQQATMRDQEAATRVVLRMKE